MPTMLSSTIDSASISVASAMLGIRGASRSGILRTCLALFHGKEPVEAVKYAKSNETKSGRVQATFEIPDELNVSDDTSAAWAVRVGIGLAMGLTREDAEYWARAQFKPTGRPRKEVKNNE